MHICLQNVEIFFWITRWKNLPILTPLTHNIFKKLYTGKCKDTHLTYRLLSLYFGKCRIIVFQQYPWVVSLSWVTFQLFPKYLSFYDWTVGLCLPTLQLNIWSHFILSGCSSICFRDKLMSNSALWMNLFNSAYADSVLLFVCFDH